MTRLLLAAAVSTLALGSAAQAQTAAGPWTGPYVGLHAGGLFDERVVSTVGSATGNINNVINGARPSAVFLNRDGTLVGGQVGYNYQRGMIVGGLELDASYTDSKGTARYSSPIAFGAALAGTQSVYQQKMNYLASARGRLGVAGERLYVYGTGGFAMGEVVDRVRFPNSAGASQFSGDKESQLPGWVAGGGVEYAVGPSLNFFHMRGPTVRVEYLHYDLGDKMINVGVAGAGTGGYASTFHNTSDVVRGAINVKF